MSDVFISYSRGDKSFVQQLVQALAEKDLKAWVDWEGIPPTAEWLAEIFSAIDAADTFVFVISPDSVASDVCRMEIAHAVERNKRLIPVVCQEVESLVVPEALALLNWLFFRQTDNFEHALETLITALDTDLEWVRMHTRLLVRAQEWRARDADTSLLVRGNDLASAETWLMAAPGHDEAQPTETQRQYLQASRQVQDRRRRTTYGAIAVAVVISVVLGSVAYLQSREKGHQEALASARELATASESVLQGDASSIVWSLRRAVASLRKAWTKEGQVAWHRGMSLLSRGPLREFESTDGAVYALAYAADGQSFAMGSADGSVNLYHASTGDVTQTLHAPGPVRSLAFHPTQAELLTAIGHDVIRWDLASGGMLSRLPQDRETVLDIIFNADGTRLVVAGESNVVRVFDTTAWSSLQELESDGRSFAAAISPNRRWVATGGFALELWDLVDGQRLLQELNEGNVPFTALAFGPRNKRLLSGNVLWRIEGSPGQGNTLQLVREGVLGDPDADVRSAAFSPDGKWVITAGGSDNMAQLWDVATRRELSRMPHPAEVWAVAFSPKGDRILTGSDKARVWRAEDSGAFVPVVSDAGVNAAVFHPNGRSLATAGADGMMRIFAVQSNEWQELVHKEHGARVERIGFSPDGEWLYAADSASVIVYDTRAWELAIHFKRPEQDRFALAFDPSSQWLVVLSGAKLSAFDSNGWRQVGPLDQGTIVDKVAVSEGGQWLAVWTEAEFVRGRGLVRPSMIRIWDLQHADEVAWRSLRQMDNTRGLYDRPAGKYVPLPAASSENEGGRIELIEQAASWPRLVLWQGDKEDTSADRRWRISRRTNMHEVQLVPLTSDNMVKLACTRLSALSVSEKSVDRFHAICDQ